MMDVLVFEVAVAWSLAEEVVVWANESSLLWCWRFARKRREQRES